MDWTFTKCYRWATCRLVGCGSTWPIARPLNMYSPTFPGLSSYPTHSLFCFPAGSESNEGKASFLAAKLICRDEWIHDLPSPAKHHLGVTPFLADRKQRGRKNCPLELADELGEGRILVWAGPNPPCRFCWQSYSCFVSVLPPFLFLTIWQLKQNINCLRSWDYTNETREKLTKSHQDRHSCFVINTWTQTFSRTSLVLGGHPNGSQA